MSIPTTPFVSFFLRFTPPLFVRLGHGEIKFLFDLKIQECLLKLKSYWKSIAMMKAKVCFSLFLGCFKRWRHHGRKFESYCCALVNYWLKQKSNFNKRFSLLHCEQIWNGFNALVAAVSIFAEVKFYLVESISWKFCYFFKCCYRCTVLTWYWRVKI